MTKVIPASVLIDICRAIASDEYAMKQAQEQMVPLEPEFIQTMSNLIMFIGDSNIRQYARNEIKGVERDSDSRAP